MGMTRDQAMKAMVAKHKEALARSKSFRCCCCDLIFPREMASHVDAYVPRDPMMKKLVEGTLGNLATYVVCQECARLPEETMMLKVEKNLVANGLLRKDLKPLDAPGGHSPGHQKPARRNGNDIFRRN